MRASDLLAVSPDSEEDRSEVHEMADCLLEMTASGSVGVKEVRQRLRDAGFSIDDRDDRKLRRARARAGIEVSKPDGFGGERRYFRPVRTESGGTQNSVRTDRTVRTDESDVLTCRTEDRNGESVLTSRTDVNRRNDSLSDSTAVRQVLPGSTVDDDARDLSLSELDALTATLPDDGAPTRDDDCAGHARRR